MLKNIVVFLLSFGFAVTSVSLINWYEAPVENLSAITQAEDNPLRKKDAPVVTHANPEVGGDHADAPRFWPAGVRSDSEVVDLFVKFQDAVAKNDKQAVASLMDYPLRVNFPNDPDSKGYTFIRNRRTFLRLYNRIFDENLRQFISDVHPESGDIWARFDGIAIGRGVLWISVICYDRKCGDNRYYLAVRTIHGNSNLMDLK